VGKGGRASAVINFNIGAFPGQEHRSTGFTQQSCLSLSPRPFGSDPRQFSDVTVEGL